MSIVNVWIEQGGALVAADTRAESEWRGRYGHHDAAKLIPLPHANMVLANRGDLFFFNLFLERLLLDPVTWNIEMFADRAVAICQELYAARMARDADLYKDRAFEAEIYAVGWSDQLQQVVGYCCGQGASERTFSIDRIESWCAGPQAWPDWESVPKFNTIQAMIPVSKEQMRYFREKFPGRPIGGKLIVAQITRWSIDIKQIDLDR